MTDTPSLTEASFFLRQEYEHESNCENVPRTKLSTPFKYIQCIELCPSPKFIYNPQYECVWGNAL